MSAVETWFIEVLITKCLNAPLYRNLLPKTKPFIIGTVYRPPKQTGYYTTLENIFLNNHDLNQIETYN